MNIEKMKEFIQLKNDLEEEGVFGFTYHENGFHVISHKLKGEPNLKLENRDSNDWPYEISVQHEGFKVFAIINHEELKDFPEFKEQAKAKLLKQLADLEKDEEATA